ncbi:MAG TPA: hypothetical protein VKZ74_01385 [Natronosporangium sp.]|nr:hypothetical protein [Natronosporangium sp.]
MISRGLATVARATPEPVLVRAGVLAAGLVALLVAAPSGLPPVALWAALAAAAMPAVAPRGPWATGLILTTVGCWLVDTGLPVVVGTGAAGQRDLGRLLLIAAALYLVHNLTALAALLPYDAAVAPEILSRWLTRALGVIVASSLLSVALLTGLGRLANDRVHLVATLAGLAFALAVAAVLRTLIADRGQRDGGGRQTSR